MLRLWVLSSVVMWIDACFAFSVYLHMSISLSLFALLCRSLRHGRSTYESLYGEEMVIASSLQPSEWPDLTGVLLQPL